MTTVTIDPTNLLNKLKQFKHDPISVQASIVDMIGSTANINAGHPFSLALELAAVMTTTAMNECLLESRSPYPQLMQTEDDLYRHMSDIDYLNRFAVPANTTIKFWISETEFLNVAVVDPVSGLKKVVIPRNTQVTVSGTPFTFVYPVEIVQLKSGAIKAYYDLETISPMMDVPSNEIDVGVATDASGSFLVVPVKVLQMAIASSKTQASAVSDVSTDISFSNQFYCARAYIKKNGRWTEIQTTHSALVYNLKEPTVVFKIMGNKLNVSLPQVYYNTKDASGRRMVEGDIRIDIYTTKGDLNMSLNDYDISSYSAKFIDLDDTADAKFWKPVTQFRTVIISSTDFVSGGRDGLTTDELLQRILSNSVGPRVTPLTEAQVEAKVSDLGYSVIKTIDNINTRTFVAMKDFPPPASLYEVGAALPRAQTAINGTIQTAYFILDQIAGLPGVIDNGKYLTLTSGVIMKVVDSNLTILTATDINRLRSLSPAELTQEVSYGNYLFTPFHYVLDQSDAATFAARAYYMDNPQVEGKSFVAQNNSSGLHVTTASYNVEISDKGCVLLVSTKSSTEYQAIPNTNVFAQLCFQPVGEQGNATITGTLVSVDPSTHERTFAFELGTKYVIDANNNISLNNFRIYGAATPSVMSPLKNNFTVIYGAAGDAMKGWAKVASDNKIDLTQVPPTSRAITEEVFRIRLGDALTDLWQKTRVVPSPQNYKRYTEDVYQTYPNDIYQVYDANGSTIKVNPDGSTTSNKLHSKGEFVLDANGNKQLLHRIGDTVVTDGKPEVVTARQLLRQIDFFALEGSYRFATTPLTVKYKNDFIRALVKWITQDLEAVSPRLIDQSRIYFTPKKAVGNVTVIGPDNAPHVIEAAHSFVVNIYVDKVTKKNDALKTKIETSVVAAIGEYMDRTELSVLDLQKAIRDKAGKEVITVTCTGFGSNYPIVSIIDPTARLSVRKRLAYSPDQTFDVIDDVTCNFIVHENPN